MKKKIIPTIETFLTTIIDDGTTIDSIIITKIDTVTPLIAAHIKINELQAEQQKQIDLYKKHLEQFALLADQYNLYESIVLKSKDPNDTTMLNIMYRELMDEVEKSDKMNLLREELRNSIDQLLNDIENNSIDSTTFQNYLVFMKITVTNPNMIQETEELSMQITKDFKIIKNE